MTEQHSNDSWTSLLGLIIGLGLVVVALGTLVDWALPLVLGCVVLIVMLHEFGHYITAKRSGMLVTDFFVGFGPVLWSATFGETRYGVRALLLGGYVKVPGMTWGEPMAPALEARTYRSASYPRKVIFASAGSFMHLLIALALAWGSLVFVGSPQPSHIVVGGFEVWQGHTTNVAQQAGVRVGDRLVSIDGVAIDAIDKAIAGIHTHANVRLPIEVMRHGKLLTLYVTPVDGRTLKVGGQPLATGPSPQGFIGVQLQPEIATTPWTSAIPRSFGIIGSTLSQAASSLVHVFSPSSVSSLAHQVVSPSAAQAHHNQVTRPMSIVGVVRIADQAATSNTAALLLILINLNIFIGLFNMLPMLPLDGGYVAIATYERLRRRRNGEAYHADLNKLAPVVYTFVAALGLLFLSTLYLDVAHPLSNPFH